MSRERPRWEFDPSGMPPGEDLLGVGADLSARTLVQAYAAGVFPMGLGPGGSRPMGWWSPDPRGVLLRDGLHVSRSLRRSAARMRIEVDTAVEQVIDGCADPERSGAWITSEIRAAYLHLHRLGLAHSVEAWQGDRLVGGLYGVALGGLFAGESMFHVERDASKVALVGLSEIVYGDDAPRVIDVQWRTDHLASLGVTAIARDDYLALLRTALASPLPEAFARA